MLAEGLAYATCSRCGLWKPCRTVEGAVANWGSSATCTLCDDCLINDHDLLSDAEVH